jgi:hypothetical protein
MKRLVAIGIFADRADVSPWALRWALEKGRVAPCAVAEIQPGREVALFDLGRLAEVKATLADPKAQPTSPPSLTEQCLAAKAGTP